MSDKALREELDQTVDRILKKLDRKTFVEGFPEVGLSSEGTESRACEADLILIIVRLSTKNISLSFTSKCRRC